jgi:ParB family chromosome partitioning protein
MPEVSIRIESVRVEGRHRRDLGDIKGLAADIDRNGLINPITIRPDGRLLAGQRRLEAHRLLGRDTIPARVVDTLDDAALALRIERSENTERLAMKPSEKASLGRALEELERPKAAARQASKDPARSSPQAGRTSSDTYPSLSTTDDVVAEALGMSGTSYDRLKFVVGTATNPNITEEERANAREAIAEMDATGKIGPAYDKVRGRTDRPRVASPRPAPAKPRIDGAKQQRAAITAAITKMSALAYGLGQIEKIHPDITSDEAAQWVDGLSESRTVLTQLINRLRERTNAQL